MRSGREMKRWVRSAVDIVAASWSMMGSVRWGCSAYTDRSLEKGEASTGMALVWEKNGET